jgi:hypothetical protein
LVGFLQFAKAFFFVNFKNRKVLPAQFADWYGHPAILVGVIMDARNLPFLPTQSHQLETLVLVNQIARIKLFAPKKKRCNRINVNRIFGEKLIDVIAGKIRVRDLPETLYQVFDLDGFHRRKLAGMDKIDKDKKKNYSVYRLPSAAATDKSAIRKC